MGSGRCCPFLPALLPALLLPPAAWGDCGPLPNISHAEPLEDAKHGGSFTVGSKVTYRCLAGYVKRPLLPDTIQCLANSQWSNLQEFCVRSCPSPPRVRFAKISQEDETQSFYPVGITVRYICRPGYENTTDQLPTSTCLDNLTWSAVPELCQKKSCGIPANPEHGRVNATDHLFGAKAKVVCNHGYTLKGASPLIWCFLRGNDVAWGQIPACWALSCPPPPAVPNGKRNDNGTEFMYDSVVMYTCDPGLQLVGNETLRCTTENGVDGIWSGSPPECRVSTTAATNQTKPSEEKIAENPYWLASILIPCCIVVPVALGILAGIIMRCKGSKKHSYNVDLQKHEMKGKASLVHPKIMDDKKQPVLWRSHFCHTMSCHVCPTCEERLHTSLAPHTEPAHRDCATCEDWLGAQPGSPGSYAVPSISGSESSPANAADELRGDSTGEALPEQHEAEQPMGHASDDHVCPVCESWLRAHCDPSESRPEGRPGGPHQQDKGPRGPICQPCADQLHLSLVHSDVTSCPLCPLAAEGTPAHLVSPHSPGCHVCAVCGTPSHAHLCQDKRWRL